MSQYDCPPPNIFANHSYLFKYLFQTRETLQCDVLLFTIEFHLLFDSVQLWSTQLQFTIQGFLLKSLDELLKSSRNMDVSINKTVESDFRQLTGSMRFLFKSSIALDGLELDDGGLFSSLAFITAPSRSLKFRKATLPEDDSCIRKRGTRCGDDCCGCGSSFCCCCAGDVSCNRVLLLSCCLLLMPFWLGWSPLPSVAALMIATSLWLSCLFRSLSSICWSLICSRLQWFEFSGLSTSSLFLDSPPLILSSSSCIRFKDMASTTMPFFKIDKHWQRRHKTDSMLLEGRVSFAFNFPDSSIILSRFLMHLFQATSMIE